MKKLTGIIMMLLAVSFLAACSSDEETPAPDGYDVDYQIKYYNQAPYTDLRQGYWFKTDTSKVFFKFTANTKTPFELLVCPMNDRGRKTLMYMAEKEDGIIQKINHYVYRFSNYPHQSQRRDSVDYYYVTTTQYFECPDLYVSDNYYCPECGLGDSYGNVFPLITVRLKEGADIKKIESKYKKVMTLKGVQDWENSGTHYDFYCSLNNSYQVLRLNEELYNRDDVAYSDVDLHSPAFKFW